MKEGWSGTSRGANVGVNRDGARALHPGDFWRSLSRHSLRDVSKPRRPSTQPLSTAASPRLAYRHRPFSTLKRRHPDSASFTEQGEECLLSTRNVVKQNFIGAAPI